jgi:hypothetical protein
VDAGWDYGIEPGYLQRLVDHWRTDYDWRAVEAHVVVPSLPGFAWSSAPPAPISPGDIAGIWDELMTVTLGHQ